MSRNKYDSSTGTLTQIGGWQGVDNALSDTSENPVQNKILKGVLDKTYKDDDTAETAIADGDYFPYYDVSASAKRKTLWSNVISKLKNVFATTTTVAPIETSTTASRAYTTGQQFILNGILYRATANISSGGTINTGSGGNATTAADVTSQISNLISNIGNPIVNLPGKAELRYYTMTWYNNFGTKNELLAYLNNASMSLGTEIVTFKNSANNNVPIGIMINHFSVAKPAGSTTQGYGVGVFIGYYFGTDAPTIVYYKCKAGVFTIEDTASEISSLDSSVTSLNTSVSSLSTNVSSLNTSVSSLNSEISSVKTRVSTLESRAVRAVLKEYSFGSTQVTSGQTYDMGNISAFLPQGATFMGLSLRNIYGYSNTDYAGTVQVANNNKVMYSCKYTQTNVTVRFYVYYTI